MDWARPNVFQRLVLRWEELHPYNGAQVARLACPLPSQTALLEAWSDTLRLSGLGPVVWDRSRPLRYRFAPPPTVPAILTGRGPDELEAMLSAELNRPYTPHELPLRLVALPDPEHGCFLGIAYRHWVADSVAIRGVLRALLTRLFPDAIGPGQTAPLRLPDQGYWRLFGPAELGGRGHWSFAPGLLASAAQTSRARRVRRVEARDCRPDVAFSLHRLPDGAIHGLLAFARGLGLRVNDVLLAALAMAVAKLGPLVCTPQRQDLALGTIVDLRQHTDRDLSRCFGLFLGFTTSFLRPSHLSSLEAAARTLGRQSALHRSQRAAASSQLRMAAGLIAHRCMSPRSLPEWYRKRLPLSGGISNVNLRGDWPEQLHPGLIREYIRVSPTGPMMPLVISATTLGNRFHFGLTRRRAVVPDDMAHAIAADITARLLHAIRPPTHPA